MSLRRLQEHWDAFAVRDPFWAVLADPAKLEKGWDPGEVYSLGRAEIAALMEHAAEHELPRARGAALDFGCGVGRLTQALGDHFERVVGVDISRRMLEVAEQHDRHGGRCRYVLNEREDLTALADASFDLVYSRLVLQHIPPEASARYIAELVRVLGSGGLLVFQLPSEPVASATGNAPCLSRGAYRARLELAAPLREAVAGTTERLRVRVANESPSPWPASLPGLHIALGNHWLAPSGTLLVQDDGRTPVPALAPGERCELELLVNIPARQGEYQLELDLVDEGVAWFASLGSEAIRVAWTVVGTEDPARGSAAAPALPAGTGPLVPTMEMHGLPRAEVERLVGGAGGVLLEAAEDEACGPSWRSFRYCVTRR